MREYNLFQALYMSFYSPSFYRDVGKNWKGTGLGYLFLLMILTWTPVTIEYYVYAKKYVNTELKEVVRSLPEAVIKEGVLTVDVPSPYIIHDPDDPSKVWGIIDTSGQYTDLDNSEADFLFTDKYMFVRGDKHHHRKVDKVAYADNEATKNVELTHKAINQFIDEHKAFGLFMLFSVGYVVAVLASYLYRLIQALIYSLVSLICARLIYDIETDFMFLLRLTVISVTPAIVLATLIMLCPSVNVTLSWKYYFLMTLFYMNLGLYFNKHDS